MGRENDVMMDYLKDNGRFADLFNGSFFGGKQVVCAGKISFLLFLRYAFIMGKKNGMAQDA